MKKLNKHKILSAACIAALPLLVVACLEFDGIIQPGRAPLSYTHQTLPTKRVV